MHWTGKVCAWLLVPLVLLAMVFTAKLVKVRNSWTKKIEDSRKAYEKAAPQVAEAETLLTQAQGDAHRSSVTWGKYRIAHTAVQNPVTGTLQVALGQNVGIQPKQWLYGFEIKPDGSSIYRGDFVVENVSAEGALLQPNWRVRQGDTAGWQTGNWRWRVMLPSAYPNRFEDLQQNLVRRDEMHAAREQTLQTQQKLIAEADAQLKLREAELVGGPELPKEEALDPEFRDGLVATIEALEEERNGELVKIDRLRRSVRDLNRKIQGVQQQNRELEQKLPQPAYEPPPAEGKLTQKR